MYLSVPNRGTALVCDAIDRRLTTRELPLSVAEERYRPSSWLRATAPYVLPRTTRDRVAFNGTLIGLRGDPPPAMCQTAGAPTLHHLGFFDFLCSNDICRYQITPGRPASRSSPHRELLTDERGRLRPLAESELSDLIGVSTIAVTSDGALLLTHQSARNAASANLLAPSGSGSLEPQDLDGATSLQDAVRRGMERELLDARVLASTCTSATTDRGCRSRVQPPRGRPRCYPVQDLQEDAGGRFR